MKWIGLWNGMEYGMESNGIQWNPTEFYLHHIYSINNVKYIKQYK